MSHHTLPFSTTYAYPVAEDVGPDKQRVLRRWTVRTLRDLPAQASLDALAAQWVDEVAQTVRATTGQRVSSAGLPTASVLRIDDRHGVVVVEVPTPPQTLGNEAAIATWSLLRSVDAAFGIEDLQGLPRHLWFELR